MAWIYLCFVQVTDGAIPFSWKTCIILKASIMLYYLQVVKPRQLQAASIPGLLGMFQNVSGSTNFIVICVIDSEDLILFL